MTVLVRAIVNARRCRGLELRPTWLNAELGRRILGEHGDRYDGFNLEADDCLRSRIGI